MAAENTLTLGQTQEIHVGKFTTDRRGFLCGSIQRKRKEAFDQIDWKMMRLTAAPPCVIPCVGVSREYAHPHATYTYSFEGIDPDSPDGEDERLTTFELDITMEEASIEAHPNLKEIEQVYGRFDPVLKRFTKKYLSKGSGVPLRSGSDASPNLGQKINPLYGTDSWMVFGATFKRSYVRRSIPANALRGIGTIVAHPKGLSRFPIPAAARRRKWLKLAPRITLRGNCVHIEENYIMSGRHGIVKEIYGAAQLEEEPDGTGSGSGGSRLTTGGLSTGRL